MTRAILASAMPGRGDRLFPGATAQHDGTGRGSTLGSGLGLAYGAAGVLYALYTTGAGRFPEHEQWLVDRVRGCGEDLSAGFYDGLHGVAHALALLGRDEEALEVLDIAAARHRKSLGIDLYGGLSGIALNQAYLCDLQEALGTAEIVADRLPREMPGGDAGLRTGLMYGPSGPALLFVRMFERTGDTGWLDQAERALRWDLGRCVHPYLDRGGVGVLWVLGEFLHYRPDPKLSAARGRLERAARSHFFERPGLFGGRAGIIAYLCRERAGGWGHEDPDTARQLVALAKQAIAGGPEIEGVLAVSGEAMPRLSVDLATGMAGVLLAAGAALHNEPVGLPFLGGTLPAHPVSRPVSDLPAVTASDNL